MKKERTTISTGSTRGPSPLSESVATWWTSHRRSLIRWGWIVLGLAGIGAVFSQLLSSTPPSYLLEVIVIQVLYAMSVNILIGYANLPSFGQAAFFGTGAYSVALVIQGVPLGIALLLAIGTSAVLAFLLGLLAVRTTGITFANVTLAFGQMLYLIAANTNLVGGDNGMLVMLPREVSFHGLWLVIVGCVVAGCLVIWWMLRTPFGETLLAVRDNPVRASSLGISTFRYRMTAFVVAGALAGLAGGLYALATGIVTADTLYWTRSGEPIIMCLLGGSKRFFGPVVGAVALTLILQQVGQGSTGYLIYVGAILLIVLILLPQGILSIPRRIREVLSSSRRAEAASGEVIGR